MGNSDIWCFSIAMNQTVPNPNREVYSVVLAHFDIPLLKGQFRKGVVGIGQRQLHDTKELLC